MCFSRCCSHVNAHKVMAGREGRSAPLFTASPSRPGFTGATRRSTDHVSVLWSIISVASATGRACRHVCRRQLFLETAMCRAMTVQRAMSANEPGQPAQFRSTVTPAAHRDTRLAALRSAALIALRIVIALNTEIAQASPSPHPRSSVNRRRPSIVTGGVLQNVGLGSSRSDSSGSSQLMVMPIDHSSLSNSHQWTWI